MHNSLAEILIATTWECNLRCNYCFVHDSNLTTPVAPMSPGLAMQIVDMLDKKMTHVETICLHLYGGEPLTNLPAMEAMVTKANEKHPDRFRFAVTTNGVINSNDVLSILELGRFKIILSIDGPQEIHDQCRRTVNDEATHEKVMQFLEKIRSHTHCWVRGSAVVRKGWSLDQASSYLHSLPVDTIKAQAVRSSAKTPYALDQLDRQEYLKDLEKIGMHIIEELEAGRVPKDDRFSSRVLQLLKGVSRTAFCGAGNTTFGITPDGSVLPCILMDKTRNMLGHICDEDAGWLKRGLERQNLHKVGPDCKNCSALPLCGGGCLAIKSVCGEDECDITKKNAEIARSIYAHFNKKPEMLLTLAGIR